MENKKISIKNLHPEVAREGYKRNQHIWAEIDKQGRAYFPRDKNFPGHCVLFSGDYIILNNQKNKK